MKVKLLHRVRLCDPMGCSLPCSSIRGIFQARVLEWVAFPSPNIWPLMEDFLFVGAKRLEYSVSGYKNDQKKHPGTSLVVHWLRLCTPSARGLGLIRPLVMELDPTKSSNAAIKDPECCKEDQRPCMPQLRRNKQIKINIKKKKHIPQISEVGIFRKCSCD